MAQPIDELKARIQAGKVPDAKVHPDWVYQRAWNDALEFVERQISDIEKEPANG